jgi:hypothetical protein
VSTEVSLPFVLRLEQRVHGARRQHLEGVVRGREDRERAGAAERVDQPAALTAATRVVWSFELTALATMVLFGYIASPPTITSAASADARQATTANAKVAVHAGQVDALLFLESS